MKKINSKYKHKNMPFIHSSPSSPNNSYNNLSLNTKEASQNLS
jgi:hypothetical protein